MSEIRILNYKMNVVHQFNTLSLLINVYHI